jgi:hypothetical protein
MQPAARPHIYKLRKRALKITQQFKRLGTPLIVMLHVSCAPDYNKLHKFLPKKFPAPLLYDITKLYIYVCVCVCVCVCVSTRFNF